MNSEERGTIAFIDVETPNRHHDSICSIAVVRTNMRGDIVSSFSELVNPETSFDDICIRVHGIAPIDVKAAPSFADIWESSLSSVIASSNIVAHNATFDLSVLQKCLANYGFRVPSFRYACTMNMMRSLHPGLKSYKLPSVCEYFSIESGHHHEAMSDANSCKNIFWAMVKESKKLPLFEPYENRSCVKRQSTGTGIAYSKETLDLRALKALAESVIKDGVVSIDEAQRILELCNVLPDVAEDTSIKPILSIIENAVVDGQVDKQESDEILQSLKGFVDPTSCSASNESVVFQGNNFILSGNFEHGTKSSIEQAIEEKGGTILKSVTKKCNYVVVGEMGNENWAMGNYGSKVKKALDWQAKGLPVQIISESELFDAF